MTLARNVATLMALGLCLGLGCTTETAADGGTAGGTSGSTTGGGSSGGGTTGASSGGTTSGSTTGGSSGGSTSGSGTTSGGGSTSGGSGGVGDGGSDAGVPCGPDAGATDLSCSCLPIPTTAPAMVTLSGSVNKIDVLGPGPVSGATVDFFPAGGGAFLGSATTDALGGFSMTVATGGVPVAGYFQVTATNYTDLYWYPPVPFFGDAANLPVIVFTQATLDQVAYFSNVTQQSGKGRMVVEVVDCSAAPIQGASVTSSPAAGQTTYVVNGLPSPSATSTDSSGTAFLFNVPPGTVTIGGTLGSTTLRSHDVNVRADVVTESSVPP